MARETAFKTTDGLTLYRVLRRLPGDGHYWNGSGFEAFVLANWATYAAALTRTPLVTNVIAEYTIDFPAGITTPGVYKAEIYRQVGVSPILADDGTPAWEQVIDWRGGAVASLADTPAAVAAAVLLDPTKKIKTNVNNQVETSNPTAGPSSVRMESTSVRTG